MASEHAKANGQIQRGHVRRDVASASSHPDATASETAVEAPISQTFLELAPDAMLVTDAGGKITQINHQVEVLFGYPRAELLGQTIEYLLPKRFRTSHVRHRTVYVEDPRTRPMGINLPLFGQRKDGSEFPVEVSLSPINIGDELFVISSIRDITERRRLEAAERAAHAAVERQRRLLQTLLDQLPGGAYLVRGPDARLVLVNQAAKDAWGAMWEIGQPMAEFLRTPGLHYFSESGEPIALENLPSIQVVQGASEILHSRLVIRRPDGTYLPILLNAVSIDAALLDEPATGVESGAGDATTATSDEYPHAALVLFQDISAIQAAEKLKDEFVSLAAHELRTPLTGLLGFSSMLRVQTAHGHGPTLADWQEEAIGEIEGAANRLNELVNDLIDTTRIQADRLTLHPLPLDLVAHLRRIVNRAQTSTSAHQLSFAAPDEPVLISADGLRLEQVFGNLLNNALKYSPQGGVVEVTVSVGREKAEAEVCIRDHGIGIPADDQVRLFQRFARAHNAYDRQIPGTGLGLYVSRAIVEQHGGHIWFESTEGQGTAFFITLPLLQPQDSDEECASD